MASIEVTKNGPYIAKNLKSFRKQSGEPHPIQDSMLLCRCGKSGNKPFCDGTHASISFKDEKHSDRIPNKMDNYDGKMITIHDNRGVCSHYGACTELSPKVFNGKSEPWINPDAQEPEETIKTIRKCPSGALSYTINGKLYKDRSENMPEIITSKDGPLWVRGCPEFKDSDNNKPESKEHFTLCRCGGSRNKPFCDGQHWYIKFKDD